MSVRTERVARLVQREVADLLNTSFSEQIGPMLTVTGAHVTRDLSIAYLYCSVLGTSEEERRATMRHLEELTAQIRTALARRIRHQVRKIPELRFFLDETQQTADRIEGLFDQIRAERESRGEAS
jgi:ribosome-binding factor A